MKRFSLLIFLVVIFLLAFLSSCASKSSLINYTTFEAQSIKVKLSKIYYSWGDITEDSQIIVIAKVDKLVHNVDLPDIEDLYFPISELTVIESLKGELETGAIFQLAQVAPIAEDPIVQEGQTLLLFLKHFTGPQTNDPNTYTCMGMYQGHYIIEGKHITPSYLPPYNTVDTSLEIWGVEPRTDIIVPMLYLLCNP